MNTIRDDLRAAILERGVLLPNLPGVAARVAAAARDREVQAKQLAIEIAADPALAARVMRVANSSLYRATRRVNRLDLAIARIGVDTTRRLVIGFALKVACQQAPAIVQQRMSRLWGRSVEVAALSRFIALKAPWLNGDEAMLAGLVHRIGELPILSIVAAQPELLSQPDQLDAAIELEQARVGTLLLQGWQFPPELARLPLDVADLSRRHDGRADYADVVTVARVCALTEAEAAGIDCAAIPAFAALQLAAGRESILLAGDEAQLAQARQLIA